MERLLKGSVPRLDRLNTEIPRTVDEGSETAPHHACTRTERRRTSVIALLAPFMLCYHCISAKVLGIRMIEVGGPMLKCIDNQSDYGGYTLRSEIEAPLSL
jgi:hypothetical protein